LRQEVLEILYNLLPVKNSTTKYVNNSFDSK